MKDNNRMISFLGWMLAFLNSRGGKYTICKHNYDVYISKPGLTGKEVLEALKESVIGYGLRYGAEVYAEDLI